MRGPGPFPAGVGELRDAGAVSHTLIISIFYFYFYRREKAGQEAEGWCSGFLVIDDPCLPLRFGLNSLLVVRCLVELIWGKQAAGV